MKPLNHVNICFKIRGNCHVIKQLVKFLLFSILIYILVDAADSINWTHGSVLQALAERVKCSSTMFRSVL